MISQRQSDYGIPGDQPFVVRWPDGSIRFENRVQVADASRLGAVVLLTSFLANSYHHQAVERPGDGLRVSGVVHDKETGADTIEATEDWNVLTTQFHPEAAQNDTTQRALLSTLGRRAQIFWIVRALGQNASEARVVERMGQLPHDTFMQSDYDWVRSELVDRLPRSPLDR